MTFTCNDLERALTSDDERLLVAARDHAQRCDACRREIDLAVAISTAARTLHREWNTPDLWPHTAARIAALDGDVQKRPRLRFLPPAGWRALAAAAVVLLTVSAASWMAWRAVAPVPDSGNVAQQRLLTESALEAIERSEAQYIRAIEELTRVATPRIEAPASPLVAALRERLTAIDQAIAECRAEITRNRFNADLRRQLLWIYQEKRRTLEEILESNSDAL